MANIKDLAIREAVLKTLHDAIGAELAETRTDMQAAIDELGVTGAPAELPGGQKVAKVILSDPKPAATVTDPEAFLAWVRDHHPAGDANIERQLVTIVRPAFQTALLAELTAANTTQWCDTETGEVYDVPGVEIRATRARSHSVRFEKGGKDLVAEAWRTGQLADMAVLQLTAGGAE